MITGRFESCCGRVLVGGDIPRQVVTVTCEGCGRMQTSMNGIVSESGKIELPVERYTALEKEVIKSGYVIHLRGVA